MDPCNKLFEFAHNNNLKIVVKKGINGDFVCRIDGASVKTDEKIFDVCGMGKSFEIAMSVYAFRIHDRTLEVVEGDSTRSIEAPSYSFFQFSESFEE
jgi:hypothetical protein